ncbi:MAG: DUF924 domain-containing protein [Gammaproteobacteria bacterium]|nr:DUF924 domain-containing protein [Gammaproteobacteria bacterium]
MTIQNDIKEQDLILRFWLGEDQNNLELVKQKQKIWYSGAAQIDQEIRDNFGAVYERAATETLLHWGETAQGALALVILLDQFSRNLFRGTARAFAQDPMARAVAKRAFNNGFDSEMSVPGRIFLMHPFHHSEELVDQLFGCDRLRDLIDEGHEEWREMLNTSVEWFNGHRDIVRQFSRFPHRNRLLGRKSTKVEEQFLAESSDFGQ